MRCPTCGEPLAAGGSRCRAGHAFATVGGVLRLLDPPFASRLQAFLVAFRKLREADGRRIHDPTVFPRLPFAAEMRHDPEWRMRGYDLRVIRRLVAGRSGMTVLDIGAWNGWLSHNLSLDGHRVTAVDYFDDELDGLGAHRFYASRWQPIQLDLRNLSVLEDRFDLVVLNRCVQFFPDPPAVAAHAFDRVTEGGMLVLTGLELFDDPAVRRQGVRMFEERLARHGIVPFVPMRGFLDRSDRDGFLDLGIELRAYPQLRMRTAAIRASFDRCRGRSCYGVWSA